MSTLRNKGYIKDYKKLETFKKKKENTQPRQQILSKEEQVMLVAMRNCFQDANIILSYHNTPQVIANNYLFEASNQTNRNPSLIIHVVPQICIFD